MYASKNMAKFDPKLAKAAPGWKEPEEVVEAFFGLAKKMADNEPLQIFMALTDVERNRAKPLETPTVEALVRDYRLLGSQYALFADVPSVSDATIIAFLDSARANSQMRDFALRGDAAGTLQALASFWQIFVRQGNIAPADADGALMAVLRPFAKIQNSRDVFDAGQKGVRALLDAAQASSAVGTTQDHILDLLAGTKPTAGPDLSDAQQQMLQDMTRAFQAQRLVSIETLLPRRRPSGKRGLGAESRRRGLRRNSPRASPKSNSHATRSPPASVPRCRPASGRSATSTPSARRICGR